MYDVDKGHNPHTCTDDDLLNVDLTGGGYCHNWRRYLGERLAQLWKELSPEVRRAIACDLQDKADWENWE